MDESAITIRRQVLEVEIEGTEADGLRLQRRLTQLCAEAIAPALEAELRRVDRPNLRLAVERMELVLPDLDPDRFESELAAAVREAVAGFFRVHPVPSSPFAHSAPGIEASGLLTVQSVAASLDDVLVHFLRTGRLPWSFRPPPGSSLEDVIVMSWGGLDPPPVTLLHITAVLAPEAACRRLVAQFSPEFVLGVLRAWAPSVAVVVEEVTDALAAVPGRTPALERALRLAAVAAARAGRTLSAFELISASLAMAGPGDRPDPVAVRALEACWPGSTQTITDSPVVSHADGAGPDPVAGVRPTSPPEDEGLLVTNAGVVLLHPFLARFFERLGVADGDTLVDPGRALCLLHLLATGERHAPEYDLVLAKLLCGIPLDDPVAPDAGLGDAEVEEAEAVLAAAIGHWEALRGTSAGTLRGEFLTRPGVLTHDVDGSPLLRVETRTSDVLLDQLPWNLSMLQLPWMDSMLRVEWR